MLHLACLLCFISSVSRSPCSLVPFQCPLVVDRTAHEYVIDSVKQRIGLLVGGQRLCPANFVECSVVDAPKPSLALGGVGILETAYCIIGVRVNLGRDSR